MKWLHRFLVMAVSFSVLVALWTPARAQQEENRYFPETGHTVAGEFLSFYNRFADQVLVFGYPITEAFTTSFPSGLTVQYFQRARFELHPELPAGQRVTLTAVGSFLHTSIASAININVPGACRMFPNGFSVCYDFLGFYDTHGGAIPFGYPISGFEILPDGRIVQYFERARFEWHPELPAGANVVLTDAGRLYFDDIGEDPALLTASQPSLIIANEVLSIRAMAFVWKAVTAPEDTQKIFIIVQDQTFHPVESAIVHILVHLPTGDQYFKRITNHYGIAIVENVAFSEHPLSDLVNVLVAVEYAGLICGTTTSFRIWR